MAKLQVVTDTGTVIAEFQAADMDYLDYSAELDAAIEQALRAEGRPVPEWLEWPVERRDR